MKCGKISPMMDVESAGRAIRAGSGQLFGMGVVMVILGVLAIAAPLLAGIAIAYLVGAVVLVAGLTELAHAFRARSWGVGLVGALVGAFAILCGMLMIAHPLFNLKFLALLLAVFFIMEGIMSILMALQMKGVNDAGWTLFGGVMPLRASRHRPFEPLPRQRTAQHDCPLDRRSERRGPEHRGEAV